MRVLLLSGASLCLLLAGCGGGSFASSSGNRLDCTVTGIALNPSVATADHTAASPGNTTRFFAEAIDSGRCPMPPLLADWLVSDATNVSMISEKDGTTNGTATCLDATRAPVTVTAVATADGKTFTATGQLTCN